MNHVVKRYAALAVLAVLVGGVALPVVPSLAGEMSSTGAVTADVKSTLLTKLRAARPDLEYEAVEATPVDGMYQVQVTGGPILYVSREGDYLDTSLRYQDDSIRALRGVIFDSIRNQCR